MKIQQCFLELQRKMLGMFFETRVLLVLLFHHFWYPTSVLHNRLIILLDLHFAHNDSMAA